jgi:hypothetical protein
MVNLQQIQQDGDAPPMNGLVGMIGKHFGVR